MTKTHTNWAHSLFQGFTGQLSWGRVCSAVSLVVAVVQEFRDKPIAHIAVWLGIATGTYTANKVTEMICGKRTVEPVAPDA